MKKIIFVIMAIVLLSVGGLVGCKKRSLDVADDAYYTVIGNEQNTDDTLVASTTIDKDKKFKIDTKKFDLKKYKDGDILKILVNTEDKVLDIQLIEERELPESLKLSDIK